MLNNNIQFSVDVFEPVKQLPVSVTLAGLKYLKESLNSWSEEDFLLVAISDSIETMSKEKITALSSFGDTLPMAIKNKCEFIYFYIE